MVLGSLASLNRWTGVKTANLNVDGREVAVAVIENARFGEDTEGNTLLEKTEGEKETA